MTSFEKGFMAAAATEMLKIAFRSTPGLHSINLHEPHPRQFMHKIWNHKIRQHHAFHQAKAHGANWMYRSGI